MVCPSWCSLLYHLFNFLCAILFTHAVEFMQSLLLSILLGYPPSQCGRHIWKPPSRFPPSSCSSSNPSQHSVFFSSTPQSSSRPKMVQWGKRKGRLPPSLPPPHFLCPFTVYHICGSVPVSPFCSGLDTFSKKPL